MDLNLNSTSRGPQKRSDILLKALRSLDAEELLEAPEKKIIGAAPKLFAFAALFALLILAAFALIPRESAPETRADVPGQLLSAGSSGEITRGNQTDEAPFAVWGEPFRGVGVVETIAAENKSKKPVRIKNLMIDPELLKAMDENETDTLFAVMINDPDYVPRPPEPNLVIDSSDPENSRGYLQGLESISDSPYYDVDLEILKNDLGFRINYQELYEKYKELYSGRANEYPLRLRLSGDFSGLKSGYLEKFGGLIRKRGKLISEDHAELRQAIENCGIDVLFSCGDENCPDYILYRGSLAAALLTKDELILLSETGVSAKISPAPEGLDLIGTEELAFAYSFLSFAQPSFELPENSKFTSGVSAKLESGEETLTVMVKFGVLPREPDEFDRTYPDDYSALCARVLAEMGLTEDDLRHADRETVDAYLERKHALDRGDDLYDAALARVLDESEILSYDVLPTEGAENGSRMSWRLERAVPVRVSPGRLAEIAEDEEVIFISLPEEYVEYYYPETSYTTVVCESY
ncbi:MAG: hypothetical protein IJV00_09715 [Clostridia bacterium]|nr:hypothetical protein [Clostridia bacterium]